MKISEMSKDQQMFVPKTNVAEINIDTQAPNLSHGNTSDGIKTTTYSSANTIGIKGLSLITTSSEILNDRIKNVLDSGETTLGYVKETFTKECKEFVKSPWGEFCKA